ncbi:MAG: T9SS type A sorting domain-containing protein [Spirosomataceae bacterium]
MKKSLILMVFLGLTLAFTSIAQSIHTVRFQVTYHAPTETYTAWVVPSYSTPNIYNTGPDEIGVTAQFSLRIPRGFSITQVTDVRGVWEKNPFKLDLTSPIFTSNGISGTHDYYVIGKTPVQTNYGPFVANQPVALFTFKGTQPGALVEVLAPNDPFISQALTNLALNVGCSFYSRSGQPMVANTAPQEQFVGVYMAPPVAQQTPHPVKFMMTYSNSTRLFTVWVVPSYSTPNMFNAQGNEFGATAQVTVKVPRNFVIQEVASIRGSWERFPAKIATNSALITGAGIQVDYDLYVIGKSATETNYGPFQANIPVPLLSFRGRSAGRNGVALLDKEDPVIQQFIDNLALNIGNSFYSRSGQMPSPTASPLEQFDGVLNQQQMLMSQMSSTAFQSQALLEMENDELVATIYPNPTDDMVQIDYFSEESAGPIRALLMNPRGGIVSQQVKSPGMGVHQFQFQVAGLEGGQYLIGVQTGDRMIMKRFVKR